MIKRCAHQPCGEAFEAQRRDARYCSASCRAAASRARREGEGTDSVPTTGAVSAAGGQDPATEARLRTVEERVMDLQADVEAVEGQVDALADLRGRLVAAVERAEGVVREVRELAVDVANVEERVAQVKDDAVGRAELVAVERVVGRVERRLALVEERAVPPGPEAEPPAEADARVDEIEEAVITLLKEVRRLRDEFDQLLEAIVS